MSDEEIRKELLRFIDEAHPRCSTLKGAKEYKAELDKFWEENNVTVEQGRIFVESGIGEMLYMLGL